MEKFCPQKLIKGILNSGHTFKLGVFVLLLTGCAQVDLPFLKKDAAKTVVKKTESKSKDEVVAVKAKAIESTESHVLKNQEKMISAASSPIAEKSQSEVSSTEENEVEAHDKDPKYPQFTWEQKSAMVKDYCDRTEKSFQKYGWGTSGCENYAWKFVRTSVNGDPLLWRTYGEPATDDEHTETTLILCGVHGDEITPIKFCYDVLDYMERISQGKVVDPHTNKAANLKGKLVIVAPLVNPDSYFKKKPTRTNANGIDVNRNFPTHDFNKMAMKSWIDRYRKDKRRFPGKKAMSEPETIFQVNLIYRYRPDKIISVHAPLTMLDYDGPASEHTGGIVGSRANQLLIRMSEQAKGYRIKNYPFFPGSLGNYAGNERNIPTFTLELPTSDPAKANAYWSLFKESIHSAVMHEIRGKGFVALDQEQNPLNKKQQSNN